MKKSEMNKLREFVEQAIQDGWRHVPMGLAQLLDTFEVDPPSAKETAEKNEMNIEPHDWEENICHDCQGNGVAVTYYYEPSETKICYKCKGNGSIWEYAPNNSTETTTDTRYNYPEEVIEQIKVGIEDADAGRVLDIKSFADKYGGTDLDLDPKLEEAGIECLMEAEKDLEEDSAMYEVLSHIEPCKGISQMGVSKYEIKEAQKEINEQAKKELEKEGDDKEDE